MFIHLSVPGEKRSKKLLQIYALNLTNVQSKLTIQKLSKVNCLWKPPYQLDPLRGKLKVVSHFFGINKRLGWYRCTTVWLLWKTAWQFLKILNVKLLYDGI